MTTRPPPDEALLDRPLWCVRLGERGICAAETPQGVFMVLFTSAARAGQFIREEGLLASERASTRLYSSSRAQFLSRASTAAADGLRGTLVDLEADGQVREIFQFQIPAMDGPPASQRRGNQRPTFH
jgi:hypothetical protein